LKTQFGLTRKVLRIGKFIEHFRAASEIYDASQKSRNGDKVTHYLQLLRQFGYGGYMLFDSMTVLDALGVKKFESAKRIQQEAYRFWLTGLLASTIAGLYTTYTLRQRTKSIDEKDAEGKVEGVKLARYGPILYTQEQADSYRQQKVINVQLVSDLCDLTVPSTGLGYVDLDDGLIGLAGTVSSLLGVWGAWQKTA
jgi:peroxin-11B